MAPEYQPGDFVLITKSPKSICNAKIGDDVVFSHPKYGELIKTIIDILPNGDVFVKGKSENSLDSKKLGWIPRAVIIGIAIFHIR